MHTYDWQNSYASDFEMDPSPSVSMRSNTCAASDCVAHTCVHEVAPHHTCACACVGRHNVERVHA